MNTVRIGAAVLVMVVLVCLGRCAADRGAVSEGRYSVVDAGSSEGNVKALRFDRETGKVALISVYVINGKMVGGISEIPSDGYAEMKVGLQKEAK